MLGTKKTKQQFGWKVSKQMQLLMQPPNQHASRKAFQECIRVKNKCMWGYMGWARSRFHKDKSKKRQKAGTPPNALTRQPKNKKKEEDRRKDGENTRKDFFPEQEANSTYKTYQKKESPRKIEERTMQASTPHTAKKQAASTNTARPKKQSRPSQK